MKEGLKRCVVMTMCACMVMGSPSNIVMAEEAGYLIEETEDGLKEAVKEGEEVVEEETEEAVVVDEVKEEEEEVEAVEDEVDEEVVSQDEPTITLKAVDGLDEEEEEEEEEEFVINNGVLEKYNGHDKVVYIPDGVTRIALQAIWSDEVERIVLSDTVKYIDYWAINCPNMKSIDLGKLEEAGVDSIIANLDHITIPKTLRVGGSGGDYAFLDRNNTKNGAFYSSANTISFEEGCTSIPSFVCCNRSLTSVEIPETVTSIGYGAFACCNITNIKLPDSITNIDEVAFFDCEELEEIKLPNSIKNIGKNAFQQSGLKTINIPDSITRIEEMTFSGCWKLEEVNLPESLKVIDLFAFGGTNLKEIRIPGTVEFIQFDAIPSNVIIYGEPGSEAERYAAENGNKFIDIEEKKEFFIKDGVLKKYNGHDKIVYIPEGVTSIDTDAITSVEVERIVLSDSVKELAYHAITCPNLKSIDLGKLERASKESITSHLDQVTIPKTLTVGGTVDHYIEYDGEIMALYLDDDVDDGSFLGSVDTVTFEEGCTKIPDFVCCNRHIKKVEIPDTVNAIGTLAFARCDITSIELPDSITEIKPATFIYCYNLKEVKFPNSVKKIGKEAFQECGSLESISFPDSLERIESYAFYGCTNLSDIELSKGLTYLGVYAFTGCKGPITKIIIPKSLVNCADDAEQNNLSYYDDHYGPFSAANLQGVSFEEGSTRTTRDLFAGCRDLEKVELPNSMTQIDSYAFHNCSNLKDITLPDSLKSIYDHAFWGSSLEELYIPDTVETIGEEAIPSDTIIYANRNTEAERYAAKYGNEFVPIFDIVNGELRKYNGHDKVVYVPDGVTRITLEAISGDYIERVVLSDTVKYLDYHAIECPNLTSIDLGKLESADFLSITSLRLDHITIPKTLRVGGWIMNESPYPFMPGSQYGSFFAAANTVSFEEGCTAIPDLVCCNRTLQSVEIPDTVTSIGSRAFQYCYLTNIDLPENLSSINAYAFDGNNLKEIHIPGNVNYIGEYAIPSETVIYGIPNTAAESYALANGNEFIPEEEVNQEIPVEELSIDKLPDFEYVGSEITPKPVVKDGEKVLEEGVHYTLSYETNEEIGTGYVVITGIPESGYTGTIKLAFKIKAYDVAENADNRFVVDCEKTVEYTKNGAKPKVTVSYTNADGTSTKLVEGTDYKLTYKNNTAVNGQKKPTVIVTGKGKYNGTCSVEFTISPRNINKANIIAVDRIKLGLLNDNRTVVVLTDSGSLLISGRDYENELKYVYEKNTTVKVSGKTVKKKAGDTVGITDEIPDNTVIRVTATAKKGGNYTGTISTTYRVYSIRSILKRIFG